MVLAVDYLGKSATVVGLLAACIAVGGFVAATLPALSGADEHEVRRFTFIGGVAGILAAVCVVFLSAIL